MRLPGDVAGGGTFTSREQQQRGVRPALHRRRRGRGRRRQGGAHRHRAGEAAVWRSWKANRQEHRTYPHMEWGRQTAFVEPVLLLPVGPDSGPAFWKTTLRGIHLAGVVQVRPLSMGGSPAAARETAGGPSRPVRLAGAPW